MAHGDTSTSDRTTVTYIRKRRSARCQASLTAVLACGLRRDVDISLLGDATETKWAISVIMVRVPSWSCGCSGKATHTHTTAWSCDVSASWRARVVTSVMVDHPDLTVVGIALVVRDARRNGSDAVFPVPALLPHHLTHPTLADVTIS